MRLERTKEKNISLIYYILKRFIIKRRRRLGKLSESLMVKITCSLNAIRILCYLTIRRIESEQGSYKNKRLRMLRNLKCPQIISRHSMKTTDISSNKNPPNIGRWFSMIFSKWWATLPKQMLISKDNSTPTFLISKLSNILSPIANKLLLSFKLLTSLDRQWNLKICMLEWATSLLRRNKSNRNLLNCCWVRS